MMRGAILTGFLLVAAASLWAQDSRPASGPSDPPITASVDARFELFSIIFRLAGAPEYNRSRHYPYVERVERWFEGASRHPIIGKVVDLRRRFGVSYDAVPSLAIHVGEPPELLPRMPLDPIPFALDQRWHPEEIERFLALARDFAKTYRFTEFMASEKDYHAAVAGRLAELMAKRPNAAWIGEFFGARPTAAFCMRVGFLNGGNNYGPMVRFPDGKEELYQFMGVWNFDADEVPTFPDDVVPVAIHEICHSYVNHLVDRNEAKFEASGTFLYDKVRRMMERQAYGNWKTMIKESIVRAAVCRYEARFGGEEARAKAVEAERKNGFYWMRDLDLALSIYEKSREKSPTFADFLPQIEKVFDDYVLAVKAKTETK